MAIRNRDYTSQYQDKSRTLILGAGDTPTTVGANFLTGKAGYTIYLLEIRVHVKTAAAQAISFADDTGIVYAVLPASAAVGDEHVLLTDHNGPGVPITQGENLDITGAAGVAARIDIVAYLKPTGTLTGGRRGTTTV